MADDDMKNTPLPSSESRQALVDALQARTGQFLQDRLESLFTRIDERLFDIANSATSQRDQTHYFDTMRMLRLHRDDLGKGILNAASEAFSRVGRTVSDMGSKAVLQGQDDELSLELVKNDVLEEMITLDNMVSKVIARSQPELDLLTRRLSYVAGHNLPEHANPFIPEYLCEGFAIKTAMLKLDFEPRLAVLKLFDRVLFKDWPVLVRECNLLLREANVLADMEKHRPAIKKAATAAPHPTEPSSAQPSSVLQPASTQPSPAQPPSTQKLQGVVPPVRSGTLNAATGKDPRRANSEHRNSEEEGGAGLDTSGTGDSERAQSGHDDRRSTQPPNGQRHNTHANNAHANNAHAEGGGLGHAEYIYGDVLAALYRQIHQQARSEREARGEFPERQRPASFYLGADQLAGIISSWRAELEDGKLLETLASEGLEQAIAGVLARNNHSLDSLKETDQSIVRLLDKTFGQLNRQALNPPSLHHLVLKLELPATWLALKDPLFLERQNHPGRRLINELCKATSTLQGEEADSADPLQRKIDEILERLNAFEVTVRELTGLLTELIDFVEKDKRHQSVREQRVLEEEEAQAKLADANGLVVRILTDRLVNRRWPGFLVTFCEKAWARVLFLACLRHGHHSPEWREVLGVLDRLLVLVSARRNLESAELSGLLASIEDNLHHIGYDRSECQLHLDNMRGFFGGLSSADGEADDHPGLSGLSVELPGVKPEQDAAPEDLDVAMLDAVDTLKKGTWVEFRDESNTTSLRCKLAGMVNSSSKLVFTNRKGAKVTQEYRHRMALKMQQGKVIVLDNSHLFDQAYDQVIAELQTEIRERSASV